jgi:hypothetical protein
MPLLLPLLFAALQGAQADNAFEAAGPWDERSLVIVNRSGRPLVLLAADFPGAETTTILDDTIPAGATRTIRFDVPQGYCTLDLQTATGIAGAARHRRIDLCRHRRWTLTRRGDRLEP